MLPLASVLDAPGNKHLKSVDTYPVGTVGDVFEVSNVAVNPFDMLYAFQAGLCYVK